DALQTLAGAINNNIDALDAAEANAMTQLDDTRKSIADEKTATAAEKLGHAQSLRAVAATIAAHRAVLGKYKQTVTGFAKAHADTAANLAKLGDRKGDLEMLKLIATDLVTIAGGIKTATTPAKP